MEELITLEECLASGQHLSSCDADGFCNHCGYQDSEDFDDFINDEEFLGES